MRGGVDPGDPAHLRREGMSRAVHVQTSCHSVSDEASVRAALIPPAVHRGWGAVAASDMPPRLARHPCAYRGRGGSRRALLADPEARAASSTTPRAQARPGRAGEASALSGPCRRRLAHAALGRGRAPEPLQARSAASRGRAVTATPRDREAARRRQEGARRPQLGAAAQSCAALAAGGASRPARLAPGLALPPTPRKPESRLSPSGGSGPRARPTGRSPRAGPQP